MSEDRPTARVVLSVRGLHLAFGGLVVLDGVDLQVEFGQVVALIGPNGAGKTSLINCLSGLYTPSAGEIVLDDQRLLTLKVHEIAASGMTRTFQNLSLMKTRTVYENTVMGAYSSDPPTIFGSIFRSRKSSTKETSIRERCEDLLSFFKIEQYRDDELDRLPFGIQKRVELTRALMGKPTLLLLDEPANGLNPTEAAELSELLAAYAEQHTLSILLIEHNMSFVKALADFVYCLDFGKMLAQGSYESVTTDSRVRTAYLGMDE